MFPPTSVHSFTFLSRSFGTKRMQLADHYIEWNWKLYLTIHQ